VVRGLIERGPSRIDIELDRLDFIDSFGISRLILAQRAARAAGVALALRRVRDATRRVLVISGLVTFLNVE
jgi:anti-anti-sigma factor